ncbi:acyl-CoA reductase [Flavobacteriaceae bacterium TK19130]|nr:acyl-CoA reductase [Thermobacterium salinum]
MDLNQRISAFAKVGKFLGQFSDKNHSSDPSLPFPNSFYEEMNHILHRAKAENGWFTLPNVYHSLKSWSKELREENLQQWLSNYTIPASATPKTVAIVMAGNIPLVGFHDFLSVLMAGHKVIAKLSSNDAVLLPFIKKLLVHAEQEFESKIRLTDEKLENFDAVIATGSNNTARYFDHYFGKYPHIIRKNRNSVAVLTGNESKGQLEGLADDIFQYFGLGCRNVSKLFVPEGYDFKAFFEALYTWKDIINNHKYINNYDYNKAVYLMGSHELLDNEFLLLKKDEGYASPIGVLFYETYTNEAQLAERLKAEDEQIQAIISEASIKNATPLGTAQAPALDQYADGVDTMAFLLKLYE